MKQRILNAPEKGPNTSGVNLLERSRRWRRSTREEVAEIRMHEAPGPICPHLMFEMGGPAHRLIEKINL